MGLSMCSCWRTKRRSAMQAIGHGRRFARAASAVAAEGADGEDQAAIERLAGCPRYRRPGAVPQTGQSLRDLHRSIRGQQESDALRPLPDGYCRSDPTAWKAPANSSWGARSSGRSAAGRKRVPTLCSPPNAVSKQSPGRLPGFEGLLHRCRLIKENGTLPAARKPETTGEPTQNERISR